MHMPGYSLTIPSSSAELKQRLIDLFLKSATQINKFIDEIEIVSDSLKILAPPIKFGDLFQGFGSVYKKLLYLNSTLQDVFDRFDLPQGAQTLLASQWPDFLLTPDRL